MLKKHVLNYSFHTFEDRIYLESNNGLKTKEYTSNYGLPAVAKYTIPSTSLQCGNKGL